MSKVKMNKGKIKENKGRCRMKRLSYILVLTITFIFLLSLGVFSADVKITPTGPGGESAADINPHEELREITTLYEVNDYGLVIHSTSTIKITEIDENGRNKESTIVSEGEWLGGSLKTTETHTTAHISSDDGYDVTENSDDYFVYDDKGRGMNGYGNSHKEGCLGKDANGNDVGYIKGDGKKTYIVKNGKFLLDTVTQHSTVYLDSSMKDIKNTIDSTINYAYVFSGGDYVVNKVVADETIKAPNGDKEHTVTIDTTEYENGIIKNKNREKTGEKTVYAGGVRYNYEMDNYHAKFDQAPNNRWYLKEEEWDWVYTGEM